MVIGTTLFQHKNINKITWKTPDAHHFSQIDHLLIDPRHVSHLMMLDHIDTLILTQIISSLCLEFGLEFLILKSFLGKGLKNMIMEK